MDEEERARLAEFVASRTPTLMRVAYLLSGDRHAVAAVLVATPIAIAASNSVDQRPAAPSTPNSPDQPPAPVLSPTPRTPEQPPGPTAPEQPPARPCRRVRGRLTSRRARLPPGSPKTRWT